MSFFFPSSKIRQKVHAIAAAVRIMLPSAPGRSSAHMLEHWATTVQFVAGDSTVARCGLNDGAEIAVC